MMQILRAEQISGYRIERLSEIGDLISKFGGYADDGALLAIAESVKGEKVALKTLIDKLYGVEGERLFKEQKGLCWDCAKPLRRSGDKPLWDRHHIKPRSLGRRDRGNLVLLCRPCHRTRHLTGHL